MQVERGLRQKLAARRAIARCRGRNSDRRMRVQAPLSSRAQRATFPAGFKGPSGLALGMTAGRLRPLSGFTPDMAAANRSTSLAMAFRVALAAARVYTARHGSGPPTPLADSATTRPRSADRPAISEGGLVRSCRAAVPLGPGAPWRAARHPALPRRLPGAARRARRRRGHVAQGDRQGPQRADAVLQSRPGGAPAGPARRGGHGASATPFAARRPMSRRGWRSPPSIWTRAALPPPSASSPSSWATSTRRSKQARGTEG